MSIEPSLATVPLKKCMPLIYSLAWWHASLAEQLINLQIESRKADTTKVLTIISNTFGIKGDLQLYRKSFTTRKETLTSRIGKTLQLTEIHKF
jgi:hypothetical protein